MRVLFVSMLIFGLAGSPTARNKQQSQPKKQDAVNQSTPAPANPVTITINQSPAPPQKESSETKAHDWYEGFWPPNWSNWGLVAVGAYGVYLALGSLCEIRKQSINTEKAANAASLNAQAVINAERAWVVAELHPMGKKRDDKLWVDDSGMPFTTEQILASKHEEYSLRIKNIGRTPAQIISFEMSYSCVPEGVTELPSSSPVASYLRDFEHLLANSDPIEILAPFNPGDYMKDSWLDIKALKKTAVFHGWVKYRHMLTDEDCWWDYCYVYTPSLGRLTAVGRYTKPRQKQQEPNKDT